MSLMRVCVYVKLLYNEAIVSLQLLIMCTPITYKQKNNVVNPIGEVSKM